MRMEPPGPEYYQLTAIGRPAFTANRGAGGPPPPRSDGRWRSTADRPRRRVRRAARGDANLPTLTGGFGRPSRRGLPVELSAEDGLPLIANVHRPGEAAVLRPLGLR